MKNVILIFLSSLISLICADDNILCISDWYSSSVTVCWKNRDLIHVNQTNHTDCLSIQEFGINSIAPNAFQDLSITELILTLLANGREDIAAKPLGIQPKSFEGLRQVKKLSISQGFLQLEHNIFSALESLEYLWMENCNLTFAKNGSFTGLPRMKTLFITFSKSFEMFPGIFTGLDELKNLHLIDNKITTIRKNIFNHIEHLDVLDFSGNEISNIEAGSFDGMSIKTLDLEFNKLIVIPIGAFDGVSIGYLKLAYNQIVQIEPNAFGNSTIEELQYTGRYITIDKQLVGLGELTILNGDPSDSFSMERKYIQKYIFNTCEPSGIYARPKM